MRATSFFLCRNAHLQVTTERPTGRGTRSQVPFLKGVILLSDCLLPLLSACGMIDCFLNRRRFVLVVRVCVSCHLGHTDMTSRSFEIFILKSRGCMCAFRRSCRRSCRLNGGWFL